GRLRPAARQASRRAAAAGRQGRAARAARAARGRARTGQARDLHRLSRPRLATGAGRGRLLRADGRRLGRVLPGGAGGDGRWSSDAYWAARATRELERLGHAVTLGCRRGTERRVIDRAREEGVSRVATFDFAGGLRPGADLADVRRLRAAIAGADVVHVHRGK